MYSDNTAANLLLAEVGGPQAVTAYARQLGDGVTRLDRNELELNSGAASDPRDTTSPAAMVVDMEKLLVGDVLSARSRQQLIDCLATATPGLNRIRKGVPADWHGDDKAGTGDSWTNDLAILWPPGRKPILVAAYFENATAAFDDREAVLAAVGKIVAAAL
jgi:beta-lactamase class A